MRVAAVRGSWRVSAPAAVLCELARPVRRSCSSPEVAYPPSTAERRNRNRWGQCQPNVVNPYPEDCRLWLLDNSDSERRSGFRGRRGGGGAGMFNEEPIVPAIADDPATVHGVMVCQRTACGGSRRERRQGGLPTTNNPSRD